MLITPLSEGERIIAKRVSFPGLTIYFPGTMKKMVSKLRGMKG